jgi:hypothetical protein
VCPLSVNPAPVLWRDPGSACRQSRGAPLMKAHQRQIREQLIGADVLAGVWQQHGTDRRWRKR